jgi:hypothetical protein
MLAGIDAAYSITLVLASLHHNWRSLANDGGCLVGDSAIRTGSSLRTNRRSVALGESALSGRTDSCLCLDEIDGVTLRALDMGSQRRAAALAMHEVQPLGVTL